MTREKVLIDQKSLTFVDLADVEAELGVSLSGLFETSQARGMAALVWVTVRRTDPTFTFADALQYGPGDIENIEDDPGEVNAADSGGTPPKLLGSGSLTRAT